MIVEHNETEWHRSGSLNPAAMILFMLITVH